MQATVPDAMAMVRMLSSILAPSTQPEVLVCRHKTLTRWDTPSRVDVTNIGAAGNCGETTSNARHAAPNKLAG
jgi:hypothetical protein